MAVVWHVFTIPSLLGLFLFLCSFPPLWPLIIVYLIYFVFFDSKSHENGASIKKVSPFLRNALLWKYFSDYFPITLYKTHELAPTFVSANEAAAISQPIPKSPRLEATIVDDDSIDPTDSTDFTISEKGDIDDESSADKKSPNHPKLKGVPRATGPFWRARVFEGACSVAALVLAVCHENKPRITRR